ncbi:MAG: hypothetical protein KDC38_20555, partial [Planctomycetes bacterium]|nr:hypothetical protein [Planctomycetota bacterium]
LLQRGRTVLDLIARDLRHASPTSSTLRFVGLDREKNEIQADNLDFVTHYWTPTGPDQADLCEVSFFVDADPEEPDRLHLYRRRDPSIDDEPFAGGTRELIARDIAGFRLEYYDGFDWLDKWDTEDEEEEELPPEQEEPEIDPETGEPVQEPDLYEPGQSGLPEAVRVTIAFKDRRARIRDDREPLATSTESEEAKGDEDPSGVIVLQKVVRLELTHRERMQEGVMGPFDSMESIESSSSEISFEEGG